MSSVNKVILIGRVGRDPELRHTSSGEAITNMSLATSEQWKDKNSGEKKEATEWHRIVFFGRQAEVAAEYAKKGALIYVEGQLKTRKWTDKDGVEKYTTEVFARELKLLSKAGESSGGGGGGGARADQQAAARPQGQQRQAAAKSGGGFDDMDDDIPF